MIWKGKLDQEYYFTQKLVTTILSFKDLMAFILQCEKYSHGTWEFACLPFGRMRTQGVHKTSQACSGGVKADVFKVSNLFGRLSDNVSIPSSVLDTCVDCTRSPQGFEFCSKLRKIQFNPLPDNIISWL